MPASASAAFEEQHFPIAYWARRWGLSQRTITRLAKSATLPYHRIGRQIRLSPSDLQEATGRNSTLECQRASVTCERQEESR